MCFVVFCIVVWFVVCVLCVFVWLFDLFVLLGWNHGRILDLNFGNRTEHGHEMALISVSRFKVSFDGHDIVSNDAWAKMATDIPCHSGFIKLKLCKVSGYNRILLEEAGDYVPNTPPRHRQLAECRSAG